MLNKLVKLLTKFPIKSIFITIIVVILLVFGVRNVFMATGNDTLVKTSTDVYQDNLMLEEEFGGESVMVLYESDHLLTPENLAHMKGLEDTLQTSDSIYSILSPVTLVEEIANKQGENFQEGIEEIIDGLDEMGSQLADIGHELKENAESDPGMEFPAPEEPELPGMDMEIPDLDEPDLPEFGGLQPPELEEFELPDLGDIEMPDMEKQMGELNEGFSNMIGAQEQLEGGTEGLVEGYAEFSGQLNVLGQSLNELAENMDDSPEKNQLQKQSQQLINLSGQMSQISEETGQLPKIPVQTIEGLNNIQQKLNEQLEQQHELQEQMKKLMQKQEEMKTQQQAQQAQLQQEMEEQQEAQREQMQQEMQKQQETQQEQIKEEMKQQQAAQQEEMQKEMEAQQSEQKAKMQELQGEMEEKQLEQAEMLTALGDGLGEMGENLQSISENMETIYGYSDIMTPGLPAKQGTLDNMVYDDGELRSMFEEVVIDDQYMLMMIRFNGNTTDDAKSEVVGTINDYLDTEMIDTAETLVSGKPVLDNAIRSSMQESMQIMLVLALVFMIIVLFLVFHVRWRLLSLATVLTAVIATIGAMGWLNIPITMVSMAVFPILIGLGIDYGIQFHNRYTEEMNSEEVTND